jgi:hypothetical protein
LPRHLTLALASAAALSIGALAAPVSVWASELGGPPAVAKPVNSEVPTVTGNPAVGQTLACSQGKWANNPTAYSYQWWRGSSPIAGQTGTNYVVQSADLGQSISCQVTAGNSGGEYTISGLPSGAYTVSFYNETEGVNLQAAYYNGKSTEAAANQVTVTAPNKTTDIDAALVAGGQITGTVTAAAGGAPLAGIRVCASPEAPSEAGYGCAESNSSGVYTIVGLPSGIYELELNSYEAGNYLPASLHSLAVAAPNITTVGNVSMPGGGTIEGTVTAKSGGSPLGAIVVEVEREGGGASQYAETNASGEYRVAQLPSGEYKVKFTREFVDGGNYLSAESSHVNVIAPNSTPSIDAALATGAEITGKVTAPGGAPLNDFQVCAGAGESCTFTNAGGEYTLGGLASGTYAVSFSPFQGQNYVTRSYGSALTVTAPNVYPNINAEMHPGAEISGRVTLAAGGSAVANLYTCAESTSPFFFGCTATNANGEYTFAGLSEGVYDIQFLPNDNYSFQFYEQPNALPLTEEGISVAAEGTHAGVDAVLASGAQISGTVTAAAGGAPLSNIIVCAGNKTVRSCAMTDSGGGASTAASAAVAVPAPNSSFSLSKRVVFDSKSGDLDIFLTLANAGTLRWNLSFKNADVGFADALEGTTAVAALAAEGDPVAEDAKHKKCKTGFTLHLGRCVHAKVLFAKGSKAVPAGTVEVKLHAGSKALKALKSGHTLHVSGPFTFQSALGGAPVSHTVSATIRWPKKKRKR